MTQSRHRQGHSWAGPPHTGGQTGVFRWQFSDQAPPAPKVHPLSQEPTPSQSLMPLPRPPRRGLSPAHPAPYELKDPCFAGAGLGPLGGAGSGASAWAGIQCSPPYRAAAQPSPCLRCQDPFQTQEGAEVKIMGVDHQPFHSGPTPRSVCGPRPPRLRNGLMTSCNLEPQTKLKGAWEGRQLKGRERETQGQH